MNAHSLPAPLDYRGVTIGWDRKKMVCLTDMWKAAGSPSHKDPAQWVRLPITNELVEVLALNMGKSHIIKATRGKGGGTWAIANLAIAYAKYLSPQFHAWALQAVKERLQEDRNPELGIARSRQRAIEAFRRQGRDDRWIKIRLDGISTRQGFTSVLQSHGITEGMEFGICTNAIYRPVLGGSTVEIKKKMELSPTDNLRDHLKRPELAAVMLSEALAEERIDEENLHGVNDCKTACGKAGHAVKRAVTEVRFGFPPQ